ncbi:DUF3488 and transglutaminase-like domain-containing protein [uncultured Microbacterium sp.]|uniref:transglutaminase family protein n=1 Tax=uncultured Microbacterium sp. TaxID=191216 RepID=UPI0025F088A0|nr:DUF3488 and transglutaminase-like domain-containing protein [uncultured Microbacterium sp.]
MPTAEQSPFAGPERARRTSSGPVAAALLCGLGVLVAVWPLSSVVEPGSWSTGAFTTASAVILAGLVVRAMLRGRGGWLAIPAVPIAQFVVGAVALVLFAQRQVGEGGLLPRPEALSLVDGMLSAAVAEIRGGVAPLAATPAIAVSAALATGLLALVLDLVLVTLRASLVAAVIVAGVSAVPTAVVHDAANPVAFVALAVVILLFLHVRFARPGGGEAHRVDERTVPRSRPVTTLVVGAVAVVAALVISPLLPLSASGISAGGGSTRLSATLDLGRDLRRPSPVTALTLISEDGVAPYLRIATLSSFDGSTWQPDKPPALPLGQGLGPVRPPDGVATRSTRTTIRSAAVSGPWLPVPYQATSVRGVDGTWDAAADNRTVVAANGDAAEQNYTVDSTALAPTLAQIRSSTASGSDAPAALRALPKDLPAVVAQDAATVAGGADTDYDKLIALQTWFRAGFRYSLLTPVEDGFDGTNVQAVARFLSVREGYCVHFAGAFALMARSLGMPTRIVVGYLPGTATDRRSTDGRVVFEVGTDELHSWPEVYFSGIGWVPFEPTATRGTPTAFADVAAGGSGDTTPTAGVTPQPTTSQAARDPNRPDVPDAGAAQGPSTRPWNAAPVAGVALGVVALLLVPAALRRLLSARRRRRAARGDALAAWDELRATLQDLGLPASAAESPRARGERLVRDRGVDREAVAALVHAVERASYARPGVGSPDPSRTGVPTPDPRTPDPRTAGTRTEDLRRALDTVDRELRRGSARRDRIAAILMPRSLAGARLAPASTA